MARTKKANEKNNETINVQTNTEVNDNDTNYYNSKEEFEKAWAEHLRELAKQKNIELEEKRKHQTRIFLKQDVPYINKPDLNTNVSGILKQGRTLYVEEEVNKGENGYFYKVGNDIYINRFANGMMVTPPSEA